MIAVAGWFYSLVALNNTMDTVQSTDLSVQILGISVSVKVQ